MTTALRILFSMALAMAVLTAWPGAQEYYRAGVSLAGTNIWSGAQTFNGGMTVALGVQYVAQTFAGLGTPGNGLVTYCSDCTIANPCAGAGSGAIAKRLNGIWVCN